MDNFTNDLLKEYLFWKKSREESGQPVPEHVENLWFRHFGIEQAQNLSAQASAIGSDLSSAFRDQRMYVLLGMLFISFMLMAFMSKIYRRYTANENNFSHKRSSDFRIRAKPVEKIDLLDEQETSSLNLK